MYIYEEQKPWIFTEGGSVVFLKIRDEVGRLLKSAGAVSMICAISGVSGDSWRAMACVDRLVELKEIVEVIQDPLVRAQDRLFIRRG